jgi:hypothetical protein
MAYNPTAGYVPIRGVPNVYGYTNGTRFVRPTQQHIANFMTPNGIVHRNINGNSYVPIAMNNMVNNPRIVNQMRMQAPGIIK